MHLTNILYICKRNFNFDMLMVNRDYGYMEPGNMKLISDLSDGRMMDFSANEFGVFKKSSINCCKLL